MIRSPKIFLISAILVSLLACGDRSSLKSRDLNDRFAERFPLDDINISLQLGLDGEDNTFAKDSNIPLFIYNKSKNFVSVNNNENMMLFMASDSDWIEIKNAITYPDSLPLSPLGTPLLDFRYTWVHPQINDNVIDLASNKILVRIFVVGELIENDRRSEKFAGAYIDIFIEHSE